MGACEFTAVEDDNPWSSDRECGDSPVVFETLRKSKPKSWKLDEELFSDGHTNPSSSDASSRSPSVNSKYIYEKHRENVLHEDFVMSVKHKYKAHSTDVNEVMSSIKHFIEDPGTCELKRSLIPTFPSVLIVDSIFDFLGYDYIDPDLYFHTAPISCIHVSEDAKYAITGSYDRFIMIWDLSTGVLLRRLFGHTDTILKICVYHGRNFSEDKAISSQFDNVISIAEDETIRIWDFEDGLLIKTLHCGSLMYLMALDSERNLLAVGGTSKQIYLFDASSGKSRDILHGHFQSISHLQFLKAGLVSSSNDGTLILWNLELFQPTRIFDFHNSPIVTFALKDDQWLVSGSYDGVVYVSCIDSGEIQSKFKQNSSVNKIDTTARHVITGGMNGSIHIWHAFNQAGVPLAPKCFQKFKKNEVNGFICINRSSMIVWKGGQMVLWNYIANRIERTVVSDAAVDVGVKIPGLGYQILTNCKENRIVQWDLSPFESSSSFVE